MCRVLEVSKSGFYDWLKREVSRRKKYNLLLLSVIKEIHSASDGVYGAERIYRKLKEQGYRCGLRLVERLMKVAKIKICYLGLI